jgi:TrpR-related protein YerC/YecD
MQNLKNPLLDQLLKVTLSLQSLEEAYAFFIDVCTVKELQDMAVRFEVARLLQKKVSYVDIEKQTGASSATIARVNRAFMYGTNGYAQALKKL